MALDRSRLPQHPDLPAPGQPVLTLLFDRGQRPAAAALAPWGLPGGPVSDPVRTEVLGLGQRFTVVGLAPGPTAPPPPVEQRFGLPDEQDLAPLEAVALHPAASLGRRDGLLPVVRALVALGGDLCALPGLAALCWQTAATAMAPDHFLRLTRAWLEGGAFPGLGLTGLAVDEAGARSSGLALFTGHEIAVCGGASRAADARLALRAIHLLVESAAAGYDATLEQSLGSVIDGEIRCSFSADRRVLTIEQRPGAAG